MSKTFFRVTWGIWLAVLAAVLIWVNVPAPAGRTPAAAVTALPEAPAGHAVGEQLPDFTLPTFGGGDFTLSSHRGQVTVLNLWATWCAPCVHELPFFAQLQAAHPDDAAVLAIHSSLVTEDVGAWLAANDLRLAFALDGSGEVFDIIGASAMLPQTVVLDPAGRIIYNQTGSVTYEMLEELTAQARAAVQN